MLHTISDNRPYRVALKTRNKLRTLQASRTTGDMRPDKSIREIILTITWFIAEQLSGERLPR